MVPSSCPSGNSDLLMLWHVVHIAILKKLSPQRPLIRT